MGSSLRRATQPRSPLALRCGAGQRPGMAIVAQAASHRVLTVTRSRLTGATTGRPEPEAAAAPRASATQRRAADRLPPDADVVGGDLKHGAIIGQYSPLTQGCPYT